MKRSTWLDIFAAVDGSAQSLSRGTRDSIARLDEALFALWNLGENVLLAWSRSGSELRVLAVRHYLIAEAIALTPQGGSTAGATALINDILAGPKYLPPEAFAAACSTLGQAPRAIPGNSWREGAIGNGLVSNVLRRYSVSLVRNQAAVLLDTVEFSLHSPLEQVAMLNSLGYSVNSAYQQLLSKDIQVNFARSTTGDGFYIWNRSRSADASIALYKLAMMVLADNAVAQRKARGAWVPRLRAAFHVGEYYEFYQVEALNPTTFSYIVGPVTIDLSRMIGNALPGQILLGEFEIEVDGGAAAIAARYGTLDFVEKTAATLDHLHGLEIAGDRVQSIRCYLTGQKLGGGRFPVNRYHVRDKHGTTRAVYNAKVNIHRQRGDSIYLGLQSEGLATFDATRVEVLSRDA